MSDWLAGFVVGLLTLPTVLLLLLALGFIRASITRNPNDGDDR